MIDLVVTLNMKAEDTYEFVRACAKLGSWQGSI